LTLIWPSHSGQGQVSEVWYNLWKLCYLFMDLINTWTKEHMTKQTCCIILIWPWPLIDLVKLLKFAYIVIMLSFIYRFDSYMDKRTGMTKGTCWIILIWPWRSRSKSNFWNLHCHKMFYLWIWFILEQNYTFDKIDIVINSNVTLTFLWLTVKVKYDLLVTKQLCCVGLLITLILFPWCVRNKKMSSVAPLGEGYY
jgi:hypothetical protein